MAEAHNVTRLRVEAMCHFCQEVVRAIIGDIDCIERLIAVTLG